jgi:hypothetical protein
MTSKGGYAQKYFSKIGDTMAENIRNEQEKETKEKGDRWENSKVLIKDIDLP